MADSSDSTNNQILDRIIVSEGGFVNNPNDKGGRTFEGISEKANPDAWKNGQPTDAQVRQIYLDKYIKGPGLDKIADPHLRMQLADFTVLSGPYIAIAKLQGLTGTPQDGKLGPQTIAAIELQDPRKLNNALAVERILMIAGIVQKNPSQLIFLKGWLKRVSEFID